MASLVFAVFVCFTMLVEKKRIGFENSKIDIITSILCHERLAAPIKKVTSPSLYQSE